MITVGTKVKHKTGLWKTPGVVIGIPMEGWSLVKWENTEYPCDVFNGHLELA